ncbi:reverse transcriptase domain-containing protein [Tanacetum coccineum]
MEELLQAPTDDVGDAIVMPTILANQIELKIGLLNLVTVIAFHGFENDDPHSHIRRNNPDLAVKKPPNSITTWNDLVSKFVNRFFPPSKTTNLRNKITIIQQKFGKTFSEAWDRFKDLLNKCPHHGFSPLHQIDTFYNSLNQFDQDSLNSAAGGILSKALTERPQGALPSDIVPNPRGEIKAITQRSGIVLNGPPVPPPTSPKEVEREPEPIMDPIHSSPISSFFELPKRNPHQPHIPFPSRLNKEKLQDKSDIQIHKFLQMFKKLHFNISLAKALALMPKYTKMLKDLLSNKEKLLELANTPLNENCSAVILKKLPEKLGDPGKFLIPCDFRGLESCMALGDLGANINLIMLSLWKKISLPELVPTRMTLELANRLVAYLAGIAEDVFVPVGKFTFPSDFVVVDYDVDPRVPLILRRPFLRTARALVDVHGEELILRDGEEKLIFSVDNTSIYSHKHKKESNNMIDISEPTCEDYFDKVFKFEKPIHHLSANPTPSSDFMIKSPSLFPTLCGDSDYLLEGDDISLYHFVDSPPAYEIFRFVMEEKKKSSVSTTTHSEFSLPEYDSFIFDLSIDPLPPSDKSNFYLEEFTDESINLISPEYDYFYFDMEANPGEFKIPSGESKLIEILYQVWFELIGNHVLLIIVALNVRPSIVNPGYVIEVADGKKVEVDRIIRDCKLELGGSLFSINLIPLGHGSFDVIVGMDWLSQHKAVIICHEKVVEIPVEDGRILRVHGERAVGITKALKSAKEDEPKLNDISVVREFEDVFPEDLSGLPPQRQVEFRIDLVPGATPIAKSPYRLAPSEMQELSGQLQELQDKGFI